VDNIRLTLGSPPAVPKEIVYEQPLNERIRAFLRLEFLFAQAAHHLRGETPWDSRDTMASLLEIQSIFGRADLKTEVLKELERQQSNLARWQSNPGVDAKLLQSLSKKLEEFRLRLLKSEGPIAADLKENEFLSAILQRSAIPGGTCDFDLPAYHHWLRQPSERRIKDLAGWLGRFDVIAGAIQLILGLIRDSAPLQPATAESGFYQRSLDPNHPCQLVRVSLDDQLPCYAEVSGGKHRFTVRFLAVTYTDGRAQQIDKDVSFRIACCTL